MDTVDKEKRFQEIYDKYANLVWWHLQNKIVGHKDYLEDIFQNIWMGVWKAIDKIQPGKEHAFIYRVIENQLKKFFYYNSRSNKFFKRAEFENSEGDEFSVIDTCADFIQQTEDPYTYFEILDALENILTEEEMEFLIMYLQGFKVNEMKKIMHKGYIYFDKLMYSLSIKLEEEFGMKPTYSYLQKRKKLTKPKPSRSEAIKKAWAEGKYDNRKPMSKQHRENISKALKGKPAKNLGCHWYNNGVIEKNLKECPEGWVKGRLKKKKIFY